MARRKQSHAHLHAVPDIGTTGAGSPGRGSAAGRSNGRPGRRRTVEPDQGLFALDGAVAVDPAEPECMPVAAILDQLAALGMPPDLLEQSRALGDEHQAELAGLLRAATAMLTGDPVAGLLGVWQPLLDRRMSVLEAEVAAAQILWSFTGATGADDLVDGLTRLLDEAGPTGRPEALVMCRMLTHLGPPEIKSLTIRTANTLAAGGLKDQPWVPALGTATFRRAYGFTDGPARALVAEFAYGRKPHAFVMLVDDLAGSLVGLCATEEVDELFRQVYLDSLVQPNGLAEVGAAEAAELIRSALALPLCPEDEDEEAEMESVAPVVRERLRRLPATSGRPVSTS